MKQQRDGFSLPSHICSHQHTYTSLRRWTCSGKPSAAIGPAAIQVQGWFYVVFAEFLVGRNCN